MSNRDFPKEVIDVGVPYIRKDLYEQLQAENERLKQYKKQRDELLSANIEKSNSVESAYSLWVEERKQLQAENERLRLYEEAVNYFVSVLDEVTGKTWRNRPDHVQQKLLKAINPNPLRDEQ